MSRLEFRHWRPAILVALVATAFGCSKLPLAPQTSPNSSARVAHALGQEIPVTPGDTAIVPIDPRDTMVTTVELVNGAVGATIRTGRGVTLVIPPGAFDGTASIEVKSRSVGRLVQLEISPGSLNGFNQPVLLAFDTTGMPETVLANLSVLWHDPETGDWVPVEGSVVSPDGRQISAPLMHFSEYTIGNGRLGKAGW